MLLTIDYKIIRSAVDVSRLMLIVNILTLIVDPFGEILDQEIVKAKIVVSLATKKWLRQSLKNLNKWRTLKG